MTPHQILIVGLRLFSILLFISAMGLLLTQSVQGHDELWIGIGVAIAQLGVCAAIWFFPSSIANKLLPSPKGEVADAPPATPETWLAIGTIGIGLWLLTSAASNAIYWSIYLSLASMDFATEFDSNAKATMATMIFELVLGAWLVIGGKRIAKFLWNLRTGDVAKS